MTKGRRIIRDIEASGLTNVKHIWCVVDKDIDTGEVFKWHPTSKIPCPECGGRGWVEATNTICFHCHQEGVIYEGDHSEFREELLSFDKEVETYIGHNFISYDSHVLNTLLGAKIALKDIEDTLVMSRLFRPVSPFKDNDLHKDVDTRVGGHGLAAWGTRLGFPKTEFNDWSKFSQKQLDYCVNDVELNHEVYKVLTEESKGFSVLSARLEHKVQYLLAQQERNGYLLDVEKAEELRDLTEKLVKIMLGKLRELFPPLRERKSSYTPRFNKDGAMCATSVKVLSSRDMELVDEDAQLYNVFDTEVFNPGSPKQIAKRLLSLGWKPVKFTPKGAPSTRKIDIEGALVLLSKDFPQVKYLAEYRMVLDRYLKAVKWLQLASDQPDGRVRGRINPIGAGTHRCSHSEDNMANIAKVVTAKKKQSVLSYDVNEFDLNAVLPDKNILLHKSKDSIEVAVTGQRGNFGWESRNCWTVPKGKIQVGCDASGIQLRALAHYMNDSEYTKQLLEGDIHVVNQLAAGIDTRPKAKIFIYAWLLGGGDPKIGEIVGVKDSEIDDLIYYGNEHKAPYGGSSLKDYFIYKIRRDTGKATKEVVATAIKGFRVKKQFLDRTPALKRLKEEDIPRATKEGFLEGLDGRKLWIPSEHLAMSMYLQGFEAVIMKYAMCRYSKEAKKRGIYFKQLSYTHDEFQVETNPETADELGEIMRCAIVQAGLDLDSNCPLEAEWKKGSSWAFCH